MNEIVPSPIVRGIFGIAGHAGIAHAYSHSGFVQEDSGGFALLLALLDKACPFEVTISSARLLSRERVRVTTSGGGIGEASARRGFSPFEESLMQRAVGMRSYAPQTVATYAFGRIYGQGVMESAAAFCLAIAKALLDTVRKTWPHGVLYEEENLSGTCGEFLGGSFLIGGAKVCWLLSINASRDGIGPNEDAEGCIPAGNKGRIMRALGMDSAPIIMLEGKAFIPPLADRISETVLLVRWNKEFDNPVVGECCVEAARHSGYPCLVQDDTYPRMDGALKKSTREAGEAIVRLGTSYAAAQGAAEKIELAASLAKLVSEDMGGSIFMTNAIHQYAGNGGMWPGHGAMLSLAVSRRYIEHWLIPVIDGTDMTRGLDVLLEAARLLIPRCAEATDFVQQRRPSLSEEDINRLTAVTY
ncbi:MAG: hypothetical protein LBP38_06150 [Desulfovibrio sp.]|jgi:hypothetical protein|nr:hypothetical protein [Desulfovibrio sp.]